MKFAPLFILSLVFLGSCTSSTDVVEPKTTVDISSWASFSQSGISMKYPANWSLDAEWKFGTKFFIYSPGEWTGDVFQENVNLVTEDLSKKPMTIDEYGQANIDQIKSVITNATIVTNEKRQDSSGKDYYLAQYKGIQGSVNLEFIQFYRIKDTTAYVLTLTLEDKAENPYRDIWVKIMDVATLQ